MLVTLETVQILKIGVHSLFPDIKIEKYVAYYYDKIIVAVHRASNYTTDQHSSTKYS